jgi:hypothetical protein
VANPNHREDFYDEDDDEAEETSVEGPQTQVAQKRAEKKYSGKMKVAFGRLREVVDGLRIASPGPSTSKPDLVIHTADALEYVVRHHSLLLV